VIIWSAPVALSRNALSGALSLSVLPRGFVESISGIFNNANLENLKRLMELLKVKDRSSAAEEKA
jgi:hypothetical protein